MYVITKADGRKSNPNGRYDWMSVHTECASCVPCGCAVQPKNWVEGKKTFNLWSLDKQTVFLMVQQAWASNVELVEYWRYATGHNITYKYFCWHFEEAKAFLFDVMAGRLDAFGCFHLIIFLFIYSFIPVSNLLLITKSVARLFILLLREKLNEIFFFRLWFKYDASIWSLNMEFLHFSIFPFWWCFKDNASCSNF